MVAMMSDESIFFSFIVMMVLNNIKEQNLIQAGQEILLRKEKDIYFIGYDNFIAITKYNRSHFYAKAVYDLSLEF